MFTGSYCHAWVDINIGSTCYLVCCIYRPPSSTVAYFDKMVDMFEKATLENPHVIALGDLNFDYKLDDSLCNNPIYYLEMSYGLRQLITEKTRVSHQSESTIDVILTSHPDMHKKSGIIKYTLSDHFLTYTEVQRHCPSKDTHKHNTVRFRDMKCFDQDKFLDDIKSNSCFSDNSFQRTPSWDEWKSTFLEISAKHAPFKTIRLKKRSNPWISADIIKLMYERDHVHKTATKNNDSALYGRYKRLRNQVTAMINANKKEYYRHVDALSKSDPKQMWGEIKQLVTNKPKHQQRLCNLTPQSFNKFFVQIGSSQVDSRGRMNANDIYWKGPKSMYTFRFKEITHVDVEQYFVSLSSKANNDLLDFDIRLINTRLLLFLNHFRESSTIPYFKGAFIWIGKEREFHQCIKEKEILILRVIIDQFLSLGILLDLLNPWYALKLFTTWKVMTSYPMTNLRISNDTLLRLVYTEWSMIGLKTLMRVNWRVHAYWIYLSVLIPLIMTSF